VVTRRALLVGGAALLAGCGKDDAAAPPPRPEDALLRELAAERALEAALDDPRLAARSRERARRLAAAIAERGGRPHDAPPAQESGDPVARARAALAAHVAALPDLGDLRGLGSDMVEESAADLEVLGGPAGDAFPGTTA